MGRKQNHRGDSNSGKNTVAPLPPSNAVASKKLQQLVRECSSSIPVHIWNTTPTHEGLVCASSFYTPLGCLDKKCKRDHSMFPLHEALAPGSPNPLAPNPSSSHKRKAPPPLSIQSHSVLTDIDEITSWKAPCSTITHIVAGGVLVYSQELGLQKPAAHNTNTNTPPPPPTTTSTTTTTTTTTTTIPSASSHLFEMLPESVLIRLFLTFLSPSSFGMVAICSKEMFSVFLGPENVAAILRHYKLGIPPTPFAAFKTLQSHFVHWRNFNALCDAIDYSAVSPKKNGGPEVSWVVRSNTGVSVGLSLSNDRRFVNVYKLDKTGSLSPAKTKIKILPTIKGLECHDMFINDNVTVVIPSSEDALRCLIYKTQDLIQGVGYVEGETELFKFPNEFFREFQNYEMMLHPTENLLFTQSLGVLGDGHDYEYEHDDYSLLVSVRVDIQEGLVDVKRLLLTSKHFPKAVDDPEYFVDEYASLFEPGDFQMTFFNNNIVTLTLDPTDHESTLLKQKEEGSTKECCLHVNASTLVPFPLDSSPTPAPWDKNLKAECCHGCYAVPSFNIHGRHDGRYVQCIDDSHYRIITRLTMTSHELVLMHISGEVLATRTIDKRVYLAHKIIFSSTAMAVTRFCNVNPNKPFLQQLENPVQSGLDQIYSLMVSTRPIIDAVVEEGDGQKKKKGKQRQAKDKDKAMKVKIRKRC